MLFAVTAAIVLAAAPLKVAAPGLSYVGLPDKEGDIYVDYFAQQLAAAGNVEVVTRSQVAQLLGFERQKQLLSCDDQSTSCAAELVGALGAQWLLTGSLAKLGTGFTANLKLVDARTGKALASEVERVATADALFEWLKGAAKRMGGALVGVAAPPSASGSAWPKVAFIGAGVAAVAGAGCLLVSAGDAARLGALAPDFKSATELRDTASRGSALQVAGWALAGTAAVAAAVGAVLTFSSSGPSPGPSAWLAPVPGGLVVGGTFP